MRKSLRIAVFSSLLLCALGCTRKTEEVSRVGISLKGLAKASKAGSLSISEITHVVLNVSGPGMPTLVMNYDGHDGRTIPDPIEVSVKSGDGRLIQILAVGQDSSSGSEIFLYGDQTTALKPGDNPVVINTTSIGSGSGTQAQIAGRYLNAGGSSGPTGVLQLTFKPPTAPAMQIQEVPVINGWFQIFLVEGANFVYSFKHDANQKLFDGIDFSNATFAPSSHVLHVVQPAGFAHYPSEGLTEPRPPERHVLGFFGPGASSISPAVCFDDTSGSVENLFLDAAHSSPMLWDPTSVAASDVRRLNQLGGYADTDGPCASGTAFVDRLLFDGKDIGGGKTKAFRFVSAFEIPDGEWEPIDLDESGGVVTASWTPLPGAGAGDGAIDGFGVFLSTNGYTGSIDSEGLDCVALTQDPATGFQKLADTTANSYAIQGLTAGQIAAARVAVCPYKLNYLGQKYYFSGGRANDGGGGGGGSSPQANFGDGSDGDAVINVGLDINATGGAQGRVTAIVDGGSYLDVTVANTGTVTDNLNFQAANAGQGEVMFIVMGARGVAGSPAPDNVCAPNGAHVGAYQFSTYTYQSGGSFKVIRVPKSGNTLLQMIASTGAGLTNLVEPWCYLQAVRVVNFNNLTIQPTRELLTEPFDLNNNSGGGVIALRVSGTLSMGLDSSINAQWKGYRGASTAATDPGQGIDYIFGNHGGATGPGATNGGGGGGHHGQGGTGGNSGAVGGVAQWHCGANCATTDTTLLTGAGGGASHTGGGTNGGPGGGIVYVQAANLTSSSTSSNRASFKASGQQGGSGAGSAGGGGGAGGSVVLWLGNITAADGSLEVDVLGGAGGNSGSSGGGGGGSGGRGLINTCSDPSAKFNMAYGGGAPGTGGGGNGMPGAPGELLPRTGICGP